MNSNVDLHQRKSIIKLQSLTHNSFSSSWNFFFQKSSDTRGIRMDTLIKDLSPVKIL